MALTSRKITTYTDNVADLSDRPNEDGLTSEQLKAFFDSRGDNELKASINGIVDDLLAVTDGSSGADQIGATPVNEGGANTVQGVVNEINANLISHESNNEHIKAQNVIPIEQPFGGLWFQIIDDYDGTYGNVIIKNATASDGEIGDISNFWLDT
jgi:hypothetical protein